jgi:hypothetical protein
MSMKKFSDIIGNRTRGIPVCNAVPQPLRHRVPLAEISVIVVNPKTIKFFLKYSTIERQIVK